MSQYTPRHLSDPSALTASEITFLRELAAGARSIKDAARRLDLSPRMAQQRSSTICQKLGVDGWREAVAAWQRRAA